jgi:hypothetical protein
MPNVISSAIVNAPPPDMMADVLNKRNKVHHLDDDTDENMIPIFTHDVDGTKRNNKSLLPRRNWCSIREYNPELTPPATPSYDGSPSPPPERGGLLRRMSTRGPSSRVDAGPPISGGLMRTFSLSSRRPSIDAGADQQPKPGGLLRRLSLSGRRPSMDVGAEESPKPGGILRRLSLSGRRPSMPLDVAEQPPKPKRSLSLSRNFMPGGLFRRNTKGRHDSGINGYGSETEDDMSSEEYSQPVARLRGGAGDDSYFPNDGLDDRPVRNRTRITRNGVQRVQQADSDRSYDTSPERLPVAKALPPQQYREHDGESSPVPQRRPFHRTPTGLSEKQIKKSKVNLEVNLEGGLDICLNVEVSAKDPVGITVPYRLLVPTLSYEEGFEAEVEKQEPSGIKRFLSLRKKENA